MTHCELTLSGGTLRELKPCIACRVAEYFENLRDLRDETSGSLSRPKNDSCLFHRLIALDSPDLRQIRDHASAFIEPARCRGFFL